MKAALAGAISMHCSWASARGSMMHVARQCMPSNTCCPAIRPDAAAQPSLQPTTPWVAASRLWH